MSWIPTVQIAFWNAWILTLFTVLHPLIMNFVDEAFGTGNINRKMGDVPLEKGVKRHIPNPTVLLIVLFVFSIFLPLKLGTLWFYLGIVIYLVGIVMLLSSIITADKTPLGQVFSRGMYRYSRHPLYLSFLGIFLGISVASVSWLYLLLSMGWMIFPISQVSSEEKSCIASFGAEYQEYMNRTPKWFGLPKSN